jgi:hypothetical protein
MPARALLLLLVVSVCGSCFGGDSNTTESGEGKPTISVEFPPTIEAGSEAIAEFNIGNPGPGDIGALSITFAALGRSDLPDSLVGFGTKARNPSIVDVEPAPRSVSIDGVVYNFEGLAEGDSTTIEFTIKAPPKPGVYANSVTASDSSDPERAKGVPLETRVEG